MRRRRLLSAARDLVDADRPLGPAAFSFLVLAEEVASESSSASFEKRVRAYAPPEQLFSSSSSSLSKKGDAWSFGCLLAEAACSTPLFESGAPEEQFVKMCMCLGFPRKEDVVPECFTDAKFEALRKSSAYRATSRVPLTPLSELFPQLNYAALHLLQHCLRWSPAARASPSNILAHPCLGDMGLFCHYATEKTGTEAENAPSFALSPIELSSPLAAERPAQNVLDLLENDEDSSRDEADEILNTAESADAITQTNDASESAHRTLPAVPPRGESNAAFDDWQQGADFLSEAAFLEPFELRFVESIFSSSLRITCVPSAETFSGTYADSGKICGSYSLEQSRESDLCRLTFTGIWEDTQRGHFRVLVDVIPETMPEEPPNFSRCAASGAGAAWSGPDNKERNDWVWHQHGTALARASEDVPPAATPDQDDVPIACPPETPTQSTLVAEVPLSSEECAAADEAIEETISDRGSSASPQAEDPDVTLSITVSKFILRPTYASRLFGTVRRSIEASSGRKSKLDAVQRASIQADDGKTIKATGESEASSFCMTKLKLGTRKKPRRIEGKLERDEPHETYSSISLCLGPREVAASLCSRKPLRIHFGFRFAREKWSHAHTFIDLAMLAKGMPIIDGWFHMHAVAGGDKRKDLLGQVRLSVRPNGTLRQEGEHARMHLGQQPLHLGLSSQRIDGKPFTSVTELLEAWSASSSVSETSSSDCSSAAEKLSYERERTLPSRSASPKPDAFDAAVETLLSRSP